MAATHVFPQSGDPDDAENFAQLIGHDILTDYVVTGFGFTVDDSVPEVTISDGLCFISLQSSTASSSGETRLKPNHAVQVASATKSLDDGAVNHVYVEPDITTTDNAWFRVTTDKSAASADALKIGEIDTSGSTSSTTQTNRYPGSTTDFQFGGDLIAEDGTLIYDLSAGHIPGSLIQQGAGSGLNADMVDGKDASQLGVDAEDDGSVVVSNATGMDFSTGTKAVDDGDGTVTINVEPADFAGSGLQDDGSDNLTLTNDSLTVSAGTGLSGGGSVSLGGSTTLSVGGPLTGIDFKISGDDLQWQTDGNNHLRLRNTTDSKTLITLNEDTGNIRYDSLGGNPSMGTHDHSESGTTTVPNAGLTNSSVTVNAGNHLSGGGAVSLGSSVTLDVQDDFLLTSGDVMNGHIDINGHRIEDVGLTAIDFDGNANIDIPNGSLSIGGAPLAKEISMSGTYTLSGGTADIDTGVHDPDATFMLALGVDTDDAKVSGRIYRDSTDGHYHVELVEDGTNVGNPDVDYDVIRVR